MKTGDIPQMWLRDSAVQTLPYVETLVGRSTAVDRTVESILLRQLRFFVSDRYASSFFFQHGVGEEQGPAKAHCPPTVDCMWCPNMLLSPRGTRNERNCLGAEGGLLVWGGRAAAIDMASQRVLKMARTSWNGMAMSWEEGWTGRREGTGSWNWEE